MTNKPSSVWDVYFGKESIKQKVNSSKTARKQKPKTLKLLKLFQLIKRKELKLLDIGCGDKNELFKEATLSLNYHYDGCDPFNKSLEENKSAILNKMNGQSDVVTLNNVLNTIAEPEIRASVLLQCHNALNEESGVLFICIYEGQKTEEEKERGLSLSELEPKLTRDGWQRRAKTEVYLSEVESIFENVIMKTIAGTKIIMATKNPDFSLVELTDLMKEKAKIS